MLLARASRPSARRPKRHRQVSRPRPAIPRACQNRSNRALPAERFRQRLQKGNDRPTYCLRQGRQDFGARIQTAEPRRPSAEQIDQPSSWTAVRRASGRSCGTSRRSELTCCGPISQGWWVFGTRLGTQNACASQTLSRSFLIRGSICACAVGLARTDARRSGTSGMESGFPVLPEVAASASARRAAADRS
jgi:hypothetical protein